MNGWSRTSGYPRRQTVAIVGGGPCGVSCALNIRRAYPEKMVSLYISADLPLLDITMRLDSITNAN